MASPQLSQRVPRQYAAGLVFVLTLATLLSSTPCSAAVGPSLTSMKPIIAGTGEVFDVTKFGAVGDGKTVDTAAIRKAASALKANGGGVLLFPSKSDASGYTFLTAPFNLSSNCYMVVQPNTKIVAVTTSEDWPLVNARDVWPQFGYGSDCTPSKDTPCIYMHQAFVFAWQATNITLTGGGTIDGSGDPWWSCAHDLSKPPCSGHSRPHFFMLSNVTDVEMSHLHVQNSPDWTLHFSSVDHLWVHHMNVTNPSNAPNSDGIDLDCVSNAVVEDSLFDVGDDALCVKSGKDYFGRLYNRPSKNIVFQRCTIGHGHGISVGSETSGGVKNVTFQHITMHDTQRGPRIKSERGRGGTIDGIVYRNITASHLDALISFTLNYQSGIPPTNATATPRLYNVLVEDVSFTGSSDGGEFDGLSDSHIVNVTLRNVDLNGGDVKFSKCDYIDNGVCEENVKGCPPCFSNKFGGGQA